jgi:hypothetical protein
MAVGFGVLAALLAGPTPAAAPPAPPNQVPVYNWLPIVGVLGVLLIFGYIAVEVYQRIRSGRLGYPMRVAITGFVAIALAAAFVISFHFIQNTLVPGGNGTLHPGSNNSSSGSGVSTNVSGGNGNLTLGGGGVIPGSGFLTWADLGWVALAVGVLVAVVVMYTSLRRDEPRTPASPSSDAVALRKELEDSLRKLTEDPEADPREVIRALYHRLLLALRPRFGPLSEYTAREVERVIVAAFGVREEHAHQLTRLFEEARYSQHPVGRGDAAVARRALSEVLVDIDSWSTERERRSIAAAMRAASPRPPPGV